MEPGLAEMLALKVDGAGEVGVILDQWSEFRANEPVYLGGGEGASQSRERGQGLNDVTEGAGLYDENVLESIGHIGTIVRNEMGLGNWLVGEWLIGEWLIGAAFDGFTLGRKDGECVVWVSRVDIVTGGLGRW